jgi:dolichyl-phosphate beta-glucosyltransferase
LRLREVYLSIIIPAYNEERRIKRTIHTIIQYLYLHKIHAEIIVVNDGSKDNTAMILKQLSQEYQNLRCIHLSQNQGKGYAIREGVMASKGQFILFSDADLSVPIQEMDKLIHHLKDGYHIAIGSRRLPESDIRTPQPLHRRMLGRGFAVLVKLLLPGIQDTQCGFKAFCGDVARLLFSKQRIRRFSFDVRNSP